MVHHTISQSFASACKRHQHVLVLCRYYDVVEGSGALAKEGERVVVHYEARWRGVTFMTSRLVHVFATEIKLLVVWQHL